MVREQEIEPDPIIQVCQGPPRCLLEGDEAEENMKAGCVWCKRITVHDDGTETVNKPTEA